jgi:hypothetical protein
MATHKTTKAEINKLIKEEFQRIMEKKKITARIRQINEELASMDKEDSDILNEVEAGGIDTVSSTAWTGEKNGDKKFKPKFEKKGTHLLEDESEELEISDETEEVSLSDEFADLGAAIEDKINKALAGAAQDEVEGGGDVEPEEDFEDVEVEDSEGSDDETIEVGDVEATAEEGDSEEETEEEETLDESKKTSPKTKKIIAESNNRKSGKLSILSEGLDNERKNALSKEVERMKRLAKL